MSRTKSYPTQKQRINTYIIENDDKWHHIEFRVTKRGKTRLYVDGKRLKKQRKEYRWNQLD